MRGVTTFETEAYLRNKAVCFGLLLPLFLTGCGNPFTLKSVRERLPVQNPTNAPTLVATGVSITNSAIIVDDDAAGSAPTPLLSTGVHSDMDRDSAQVSVDMTVATDDRQGIVSDANAPSCSVTCDVEKLYLGFLNLMSGGGS